MTFASALSFEDDELLSDPRAERTRGNSFYDGTLVAEPSDVSSAAAAPLGDVFEFEEHGAWDNFLRQYRLESVRDKFMGRSPLDYLMSLIPAHPSAADKGGWDIYTEVCTEAGLTIMEKHALKQALIEYSSAKFKRKRESEVHSRSFLSERAIHVLHPSVFEHNFDSDQKVTFSFAVAGGGLAGKTSLIRRLHSDVFDPTYTETVSLDVQTLYLAVNPERSDIPVCKVHLWDYGGQDGYRRQIPPQFVRGKHAILFVYDIMRRESLYEIRDWFASISEIIHMDEITCVLVGSKSDLLYECDTFTSEDADKIKKSAMELAQSLGMTLYQVSSKSGQNIVPMIVDTVKQVLLAHTGIDSFKTHPRPSHLSIISDDQVETGELDRVPSKRSAVLSSKRSGNVKLDRRGKSDQMKKGGCC